MTLVDFFKSAAQGYGTEKRILLLHGPVGSSKSTIARLLKKGLETYSRSDAGKTFSYSWRVPAKLGSGDEGETILACPMHEEPLLLIPIEARKDVLASRLTRSCPTAARSSLYGDCLPVLPEDPGRPDGAVRRRLAEDDRAREACSRLVLSEKDRRGIGTFQPKDEKNQDSTELTGDINYRKIAEYGSLIQRSPGVQRSTANSTSPTAASSSSSRC